MIPAVVRLTFEQRLPVPAARAWPQFVFPALINRWSRAAVEVVRLGDGGHPGGVGAVRIVRLPGRTAIRLAEVIEESRAPTRLVYRVFGGAPVREHRGEIALTDESGGCRVDWTVTVRGALPGVERLVRPAIGPALERSLATLAERVVDARAAPPPPPERALDEFAALSALVTAARACAAEQDALAGRLLGHGDDRGWFARASRHINDVIVEHVLAGRFAHPAWALRLVAQLHRLYVENLRRRLGEDAGEVEGHWRHAFAATERLRSMRRPFESFVTSLYLGMRAHIEHDLPRALAEVYRLDYAERCDYARFRSDSLRLPGIFTAAADRLLGDVPRASWSVRARLLRLVPSTLRDQVIERGLYPIGGRQREAFERGAALSALGGLKPKPIT
jgi:hypothetical protein